MYTDVTGERRLHLQRSAYRILLLVLFTRETKALQKNLIANFRARILLINIYSFIN